MTSKQYINFYTLGLCIVIVIFLQNDYHGLRNNNIVQSIFYTIKPVQNCRTETSFITRYECDNQITYEQYIQLTEVGKYDFQAADASCYGKFFQSGALTLNDIPKLLAVTPCNQPTFFYKTTLTNLRKYGFETFQYGMMHNSRYGEFIKIKAAGMNHMLERVKDNTIILSLDAVDVLTVGSPTETISRFLQLKNCDIVFSAERGCDGIYHCFEWMLRYLPEIGNSKDRFPNSGLFIGWTWAIREFMNWNISSVLHPDKYPYDPTKLSDQYYDSMVFIIANIFHAEGIPFKLNICLDTHHFMFGNLYDNENLFHVDSEKKFFHNETHGRPLFLQANGRKEAFIPFKNTFGYADRDGYAECNGPCYSDWFPKKID